jgi:hypothetical protein
MCDVWGDGTLCINDDCTRKMGKGRPIGRLVDHELEVLIRELFARLSNLEMGMESSVGARLKRVLGEMPGLLAGAAGHVLCRKRFVRLVLRIRPSGR